MLQFILSATVCS